VQYHVRSRKEIQENTGTDMQRSRHPLCGFLRIYRALGIRYISGVLGDTLNRRI
jgi:hypothetical protein